MDPVPCPFPVAKLPAFVRPWPGDGSDTDRIDWFLELERCARNAGGRAHFAEFCRAHALEIATKLQHGLIAGLTEKNKLLERKLEEKATVTEKQSTAIVEKVFAAVRKQLEADVEAKLAAAVKAIELRFEQQGAYENGIAARVGALANAVDHLERQLSEQEWRVR